MSRVKWTWCLLALAGSAGGIFLCGGVARLGGVAARARPTAVLNTPNSESPFGAIPIAANATAPIRTAATRIAERALRPPSAPFSAPPAAPVSAAVSVPVTFEENVGQARAGVRFVGRGKDFDVALDEDGLAFRLASGTAPNLGADTGPGVGAGLVRLKLARLSLAGAGAQGKTRKKRSGKGRSGRRRSGRRRSRSRSGASHSRSRKKDSVLGKSPSKFAWRGMGRLRGEVNYLIGNDRSKWHRRVPLYEEVGAENVETGVAMKVYGRGDGFEYDLRVAPGIDAADLRLEFSGAGRARIEGGGDLVVGVGTNELRMKKPEIYSIPRGRLAGARARVNGPKAGARSATAWDGEKPKGWRTVSGGYVLEADGSVGFAVGAYDHNETLVIDPSLSVAYSTFLGGGGSDNVSSIALDPFGNVYVAGTTTSPMSFAEPTTAGIGPGLGTNPLTIGSTEYFVAKIAPSVSGSSSLVYLTFLGGSVSQAGGIIAIDSSGDVAITGTTTSPDFPVTDGSALTSGANDVTVSEIDPTGSVLLFSTLFGGSGAESQYAAGGIAVDTAGNIYVATDTSSMDLSVTTGVFQPTFAGGSSDGFLAVFQPSAAPSLTYCSYLGTNANAQVGVGGVAIDAASNVYIAGFSSNAELAFPVKNAFQSVYGGDPADAFLMKILPEGQGAADVIYATLLGGNGLDEALAVAVDTSVPANAYVTGTTQSKNFPTNGTTVSFQPALHASATANAFLTVVAQNPATGVAVLAYSTYLGGSANDSGLGLAVTAFNSVYVSGVAHSWDFPWHDNLQPFNGSSDAFVAKLDPSAAGAASLVYATPLGGTAPPGLAVSASGSGIAADAFGDVYVAGQTTASDFPTAVTTGSAMNGFQPICASCQNFPATTDAFLMALHESASQQASVYFNIGSVVFPAAPIGTQNSPQPVAVHNGGEAPLAISSLQITGPNAQDYSLIGPGACKLQTINVGGECSFEVGFVPSTTGAEEAVVTFSDNAPGSPHVLELIGAGQGPLVSLSTTNLNFGSQPENINSVSEAITVSNIGNQTLTLQSPVESGADTAEFFLSGRDITCGSSLAAGASCAIGVVFSPKTIGLFTAQITLTDNSGGIANSTQVINLIGTATAPAPVATVTPSALDFGDIQVGTAAGAQVITLSNSGSTALNITSITISGSNAADYSMLMGTSSPCPTGGGSVAAGASCNISVRFAPSAADAPGTKTASLVIADNAAGSPHVVALSGTATTPATIQISPAALTFLPQSSGIASAAQSLTILNTSAGSLAVNGFSMAGANAADFSQTNNCPPSVRSGASCTVNVVFTPTFQTSAARTATLSVADNASPSPQTIPLTGTATQASVQISPTSINFGSQQAATASPAQTITVTNTGTGGVSISSITASDGADFVIGANTCKSTVTPPGGTCTVQVSFSPACTNGTAARSGTLVLTDNVPGSPQSVGLSGAAAGDFCFVAASAAAVSPGQTATYSLVVNSPTAYRGTVSLACAGAPSLSSCAVPASVTVPSQFAMSVATAASSGAPLPGRRMFGYHDTKAPLLVAGAMLILVGTAFLCGGWTKAEEHSAGQYARYAAVLVLMCSVLWIAACSNGGGGNATPATVPGTPVGTYTLTLTGTSPNTTSQVTVALTVQ